MSRWEPNAGERLVQAAMELFHERGYAGTTVQEIAARAGLTERTFFRYFTDKREVLFGGSEALRKLMVESVESAEKATPPFDAVALALEAAASELQGRREHAKARATLIAAHPELLERELIKLTSLAAAVAEALRARGVSEPEASLAAEAAIAIFKVAFERWIADNKRRDFLQHIRSCRDALEALAAGKKAKRSRKSS